MREAKKWIQRIELDKYFSYWVVLLIDMFVSTASTLISFLGISYLSETIVPSSVLILTAVVSMGASLIAFFSIRTYKIIIRYSTLKEISRFVAASLLKGGVLIVYLWIMASIVPDFRVHGIFYICTDMVMTFEFTCPSLSSRYTENWPL